MKREHEGERVVDWAVGVAEALITLTALTPLAG